MHRALALLPALILSALLAVPSQAAGATTIGHAAYVTSGDNSCMYGGTMFQRVSPAGEYAAPFDGVITSWTTAGSFPSLTFKVGHLGSGDSITVDASDGPRAFSENVRSTYQVRIAVRQGDVIGGYGESRYRTCVADSDYTLASRFDDVPDGQTKDFQTSQPIQLDLEATIEHDADGDGYGDETQDRCPWDSSTHGPCPLPMVLGQTFSPTSALSTGDVARTGAVDVPVAAPRAGVITSWAYLANSNVAGTLKLKMFRPLGSNDYRVVGAAESRTPVANTLNEFATRIPVREGDLIGVHAENVPVNSGPSSAANSTAFFNGDLAPGASATFVPSSSAGRQIDISAVLEADLDGDGYGDASQDACPSDASTQGECPVAQPPATGPPVTEPPVTEPPVVLPPLAQPDDAACDAAHDKLDRAKAKLKKLKRKDAAEKKIERAKKKVKKAKGAVKAAC